MKLHGIRGGNLEDLENRKYNIAVGVSLGNKWFTVENILQLVKWSLRYTRKNVAVYIADSIHAINYEVRKRVKFEKALEEARQEGKTLIVKISEAAQKDSSIDHAHVQYAIWDDLIDSAYIMKRNYLYDLYKNNENFKQTIQNITRSYLSGTPRAFSESDISRLGMYLIEELPEVINRVPIKGEVYDAFTYPYDGEFTQLVEKIQTGAVFPEIKQNIMDTEPKVFLQVR